MKIRNQSGFAVVEAILVIVVLGIVGFTGWFVWHSKQTADKTYSTTANSTLAVPKKKITTVVPTTTPQTPASTPITSVGGVLIIKDWGVGFHIPSALKSMQYVGSGNEVSLDSTDLFSLSGNSENCSGNEGYLGSLYRSTDPSPDPTHANILKKLGDYYYFYTGPQQGCSGVSQTDTDSAGELQNKMVGQLLTDLPTTLVQK